MQDDDREICTDEEIRDFLFKDLGLTVDDIKKYIEHERDIITQGILAPDLFPTSEELDQVFRVMKSIVNGTPISNPIDDYDRAMGIL